MWTYEQRTGTLRHNGETVGTGYAGIGEGKNNPEAESLHDVGPLPQGLYLIGKPYTDPHLGPLAMRLTRARLPTGALCFRTNCDRASLKAVMTICK